MDRVLDQAEIGSRFLGRPEIADLVVSAILYRDRNLQHYRHHSYAVMPNHFHLLVTPRIAVSKLMQSLKRFTACQSNQILGRTGQPFWQDESYDRLVRNDREFRRIVQYIEMNPVRAGLVTAPEMFPWSSARADLAIGRGLPTRPTAQWSE